MHFIDPLQELDLNSSQDLLVPNHELVRVPHIHDVLDEMVYMQKYVIKGGRMV
jgi:hypothetical protein